MTRPPFLEHTHGCGFKLYCGRSRNLQSVFLLILASWMQIAEKNSPFTSNFSTKIWRYECFAWRESAFILNNVKWSLCLLRNCSISSSLTSKNVDVWISGEDSSSSSSLVEKVVPRQFSISPPKFLSISDSVKFGYTAGLSIGGTLHLREIVEPCVGTTYPIQHCLPVLG